MQRLLQETTILRTLPLELLTELEITVVAFQKSYVYNMHRARCAGSGLFHNHVSRINCAWILTADEDIYGVLRAHLTAWPLALFKMSDCTKQDTVH